MRRKDFFVVMCMLITIGILAGCGPSIEEVSTETTTLVEQAFNDNPTKPNNTKESLSYYLPADMAVESEEENNIILKQGEQLFILFVNPNEPKNSQVMYESILSDTDKTIVNETFSNDSKFGYVHVEELDDDNYEVSVGVGGVKMTTTSELKNVSELAQQMMVIVSSVEY